MDYFRLKVTNDNTGEETYLPITFEDYLTIKDANLVDGAVGINNVQEILKKAGFLSGLYFIKGEDLGYIAFCMGRNDFARQKPRDMVIPL